MAAWSAARTAGEAAAPTASPTATRGRAPSAAEITGSSAASPPRASTWSPARYSQDTGSTARTQLLPEGACVHGVSPASPAGISKVSRSESFPRPLAWKIRCASVIVRLWEWEYREYISRSDRLSALGPPRRIVADPVGALWYVYPKTDKAYTVTV